MGLPKRILARKVLEEVSKAVVLAFNEAIMSSPPSPSPTKETNSSIQDIGSYLLSRSRVKPPTIIVIVLVASLFLIACFSIYVTRCYTHRRTTTSSHHAFHQLGYQQPGSTLPSSSKGGGIDTLILESLPKIIFSSLGGLPPIHPSKRQTECAICLEEFMEEESIRVLPPCGHIFHPECIHMWLFNHTACPLCRCSLLSLVNPITPPNPYLYPLGGGGDGGGGERVAMLGPVELVNGLQVDLKSVNQGETSTCNNYHNKEHMLRKSPSMGNHLIKGREVIRLDPPLDSSTTPLNNKNVMPPQNAPSSSSSLSLNSANDFHRSRSYSNLPDLSPSTSETIPPDLTCPFSPNSPSKWHDYYLKKTRLAPPKDVGKSSNSFYWKFLKRSTSDMANSSFTDHGESSSSTTSVVASFSPFSIKRTLTKFASAKEARFMAINRETAFLMSDPHGQSSRALKETL